MDKLINVNSYPINKVLKYLLIDKTTGKNIIWATDTYTNSGKYKDTDTIEMVDLIGFDSLVLQPRISKSMEEQQQRTRKKAEVFTPVWLCNHMNNYCDEQWFGRKEVFNIEREDHKWKVVKDKIEFPKGKNWKKYVDSRRLEITCGEAPFLVSRYDMATGNLIRPPMRRIGILDRKMRIVNENASDEEWLKWAIRAIQACYGFEYQGDNLLIARINMLLSFVDYYMDRFLEEPDIKIVKKVSTIISWNLWQMDGLLDVVPKGSLNEINHQFNIFEMFENDNEPEYMEDIPCRIYNWRSNESLLYKDCKGDKAMNKKLFDYCIGNPPYQKKSVGANANDTPVYHFFYDAAINVARKVELITPARFLFNAGGTPKEWNEKMLSDTHFKIMKYEGSASNVFRNTSIAGGVAVTYYDESASFDPVGVFTPFEELNTILKKTEKITKKYLSDTVTNRGLYKYSDLVYMEHPKEMERTADRRIAPSAFERMPELFTENKPNDGKEYIQIYGPYKNERTYRWFRKDYVDYVDNLIRYKVLVSKADGAAGQLGNPVPARIMGKPVVISPNVGFAETFISIVESDSMLEAEAAAKYLKTKYARTMLGVLKVTQNNPKPTWGKVPMQVFNDTSDIDWSKSIHEIDLQLYKKYELDDKEISFIESYVKEMS